MEKAEDFPANGGALNYYALSTLPCKLINGGETLKIITVPFPAVGGGRYGKKRRISPPTAGR